MARDNLPGVGHELDERIAVEIFGQNEPELGRHNPDHLDVVEHGVWFCIPDYYQGDRCLWEPRHFSISMHFAWKMVDKMKSLGYYLSLEESIYHHNDLWTAVFRKDPTNLASVLACASTPAHALCLAALLATKG